MVVNRLELVVADPLGDVVKVGRVGPFRARRVAAGTLGPAFIRARNSAALADS